MKKPSVAVVGVTGMVGGMFIKILEERKFPADKFYAFASARSAGGKVTFNSSEYTIEELKEDSFDRGIDVALFSAGGDTSKKFAPIAAKRGCVAVDNSSAWRMDDSVPLVVPEVNPEDIKLNGGIVANPNCSVIPSVIALKPLHDKYKIKRVVYSTYQSVSGAGRSGYNDLEEGLKGRPPKKFPRRIAHNCLPHIDDFTENGYTKEEMKMIAETQKILHAPEIKITTTNVRVPVFYGHCVSINAEFHKPFDLDELILILKNSPGVVLQNDHANNEYPTPVDAAGRDDVFVGRIRRDFSVESGVNLWAVADNVRKGAATNAVQIAEKLFDL